MSRNEVVANCDLDDVTIFLVENCSTEALEQDGSTSSKFKRRRTRKDSSQAAHGKQVGEVKVKASRLRQCSTYFDTCMSERWARSKAEFHLELHAELRFYEEASCIELLKVASQIGFQGVIDLGMKYLAAAPWSDGVEKLVHAFCDSQLVPLDSLTELLARLDDFPLAEDEQLSKDLLFARNLLSDYLQCALEPRIGRIPLASMTEADRERYRSVPLCLRKFGDAFYLVVSGEEPGVCASVVEHALNLLKQATLTLLSDLKETFDDANPPCITRVALVLFSFCCLYDIARKSNAAQTMVEVLLDDVEVSKYVLRIARMDDSWNHDGTKKWAQMICCIFQDVLDGTLFLDTSQRLALFNQWCWVLRGDIMKIDRVHGSGLITRFLTTLPRQKQVEMWMASELSDDHGPSPKAHNTWFSYMIMGKAKRELYEHQERLKVKS